MKKIKKSYLLILAILLVLFYIFFATPNLNPIYSDGAFFWLVLISIIVFIVQFYGQKVFSQMDDSQGKVVFKMNHQVKIKKWLLFSLGGLWLIYLIVMLISTPLFNSEAYRNQMKDPEVKSFSSHVQAIDLDQIPIVDKELAYKLADKKLGEKPSLGSQVELGEPTIQQVNGKLVWVVPLHHSGFFKWLSNMDGAQGYIIVAANSMQDVTYVEDYKIKIQPDSYFFDDLVRHARIWGSFFTGITDYSFEIDDDGNPFWVVTTYRNNWGFSLPEANGILLIDAQTGETKRYALDEIPSWIDRVQPEDFLIDQIDNKGEYIHGVFNFSNYEKFRSSNGDIIVYNDGRCYLFTGITSVGSDESAIGFYMVDMVTKEPIMYKMNGATEYAAMKSAEGKVQDLKYNATFPLIINMEGMPTYFMTLKDNEGLIKNYAMVSVEDYSTVGVGATLEEALSDYQVQLKNNGLVLPETPSAEEKETLSGTVMRIAQEVTQQSTVYYLILNEAPNYIFRIESGINSELALTQPGDQVSVEFVDHVSGIVTVTSFDNLQFTQGTVVE